MFQRDKASAAAELNIQRCRSRH